MAVSYLACGFGSVNHLGIPLHVKKVFQTKNKLANV